MIIIGKFVEKGAGATRQDRTPAGKAQAKHDNNYNYYYHPYYHYHYNNNNKKKKKNTKREADPDGLRDCGCAVGSHAAVSRLFSCSFVCVLLVYVFVCLCLYVCMFVCLWFLCRNRASPYARLHRLCRNSLRALAPLGCGQMGSTLMGPLQK